MASRQHTRRPVSVWIAGVGFLLLLAWEVWTFAPDSGGFFPDTTRSLIEDGLAFAATFYFLIRGFRVGRFMCAFWAFFDLSEPVMNLWPYVVSLGVDMDDVLDILGYSDVMDFAALSWLWAVILIALFIPKNNSFFTKGIGELFRISAGDEPDQE